MKEVEISIDLSKPLQKIVYEALLPEIGKTGPRTQVNITETNVGISLKITAENTSALRAGLNSYLRWLDCIISIATEFSPDP